MITVSLLLLDIRSNERILKSLYVELISKYTNVLNASTSILINFCLFLMSPRITSVGRSCRTYMLNQSIFTPTTVLNALPTVTITSRSYLVCSNKPLYWTIVSRSTPTSLPFLENLFKATFREGLQNHLSCFQRRTWLKTFAFQFFLGSGLKKEIVFEPQLAIQRLQCFFG